MPLYISRKNEMWQTYKYLSANYLAFANAVFSINKKNAKTQNNCHLRHNELESSK